MKKTLLNLALFQLGWLVCVLGGNLYAGVFTLLALALHHWLVLEDWREWRLIAAVVLVGSLWDIAMAQTGAIRYGGGLIAGIPPWLVCLWAIFATTFMHSLHWLRKFPWLAAALAGILGPASYWFGAGLAGADLRLPLVSSLGVMAVGWALLFPLGMFYAARLKSDIRSHHENPA